MVQLIGHSENNFLVGSNEPDEIFGLLGDDILLGNQGDDLLYGGQGDDLLFGGLGQDSLFGNKNNDVLYGGKENDVLFGGEGNDSLFGQQGNDTLYGDLGSNTLTGGVGNDVFLFQQNSGSLQLSKTNIVTDFTIDQDQIQLQGILVSDIDFKDNGSGGTILQNKQTLEILAVLQGVNSSNVDESILVSDIEEPEPTASPTPQPSPTPTPEPTASPTPQPSPTPTPQPTPQPSPTPTPQPTPQPSPTPTPQPSPTPTPQPTPSPTPQPSPTPTPIPDTEPPQSEVNQPLQVAVGETQNITQTELKFADNQQTDLTKIVYTITNLPDQGELKLNGTVLTENQTFTQADINEGKISYTQSKSLLTDQSVFIQQQLSNFSFLNLVNSDLFWFSLPTNGVPGANNSAAFRFDGQEIVQLTDFIYSGGGVISGEGEKFKDTALLYTSNPTLDVLKVEGKTATSISPNTTNNYILSSISNSDFYILQGQDNGGQELLVYDGTTTTQYTNEDFARIAQVSISSVVDGKPTLLLAAAKNLDSAFAVYQSNGTQTLKLTPDLGYFPAIYIYPANNSSFFVAGVDQFLNGPSELQAVWAGEIFFFDGENTTKISNNSSKNVPLFSNSGNLWWKGDDGTGIEIFKSDGITTTQITNNNYTRITDFKQVGDANSNLYVLEIKDGTTTHIFSYNTDTDAIEQLSSDSTNNKLVLGSTPGKIDPQSIYWVGDDGSGSEFYRFNGTSSEKITNGNFSTFKNTSYEFPPTLFFDNGEKIGVISSQIIAPKLYIADQTTTLPINPNSVYDTLFKVDENLGVIATTNVTDAATNTNKRDIIRYDLNTNTTIPLTQTGNVLSILGQSEQDEIFWSGFDGTEDGNDSDLELFRYDPITNRNTQLTNQNFTDLSNLVIDSASQTLYFRQQLPPSEDNNVNNFNLYRYDLTKIPTSLTDSFQFTVSDSIQSTNSQSFNFSIS